MIIGILKRLRYNPSAVAQRDSRVTSHPSAILLDSARFDFQGSGGRVTLGADCMVGGTFTFESDAGSIDIGQRTYVGGGTQMISRTSISVGNDVMIAWGCYLYDHNAHSLDWEDRMVDVAAQTRAFRAGLPLTTGKNWSSVSAAPIRICDKAWIGFEAAILKGVVVGEGAIVAARSVVTKDVPPWSVVAGNPAVKVKDVPGAHGRERDG
ncbi:MAG: acyltransferase [Gemmatimonadaceae bacterium]